MARATTVAQKREAAEEAGAKIVDVDKLTNVTRLSRDIRTAAKMMNKQEARFLVDTYYLMQDARIRTAAQVKAMQGAGEPNSVLQWLSEQNVTMEGQVKNSLNHYAKNHPVGQWLLDVKGVGPVIAAGLLAYIDIHRAPVVGNIWSYAGLRPDQRRQKGQKANWNPQLKVLCWKIGESFVKVSGREDAYYGQVYKARKEYETRKNEAGDYADQAAASLERFKYGDDTVAKAAYEKGMLPLSRIHERAKRYAVKLLLAHLHEVWYVWEFGVKPPHPYPIAHMGHVHHIPPPGGQPIKEQ